MVHFDFSVLGETSDPRDIRDGLREIPHAWHEAHVADTLMGNYAKATAKMLATRAFPGRKR